MGQAKLKKVKPTVFVGPRGNVYYCRNRCGSVAYTKDNNQIFTERPDQPGFGWCHGCKEEARRRHQQRLKRAQEAAEAQTKAEHLAVNVGGELAAAAAARAANLQEMLRGDGK